MVILMNRTRNSAAITFLLVVLSLHFSVQAATFVVDNEIDDIDNTPGDGVCAAEVGGCTLRAAIQEANALPGLDTISITSITCTLSRAGADEDGAATGDLDITDDLTITGVSPETSTIDGGGIDRVLHIHHETTVELTALTVQNGNGGDNPGGGGVLNHGNLTLTNSIVSRNTVDVADGGGILNDGALTLVNSTVSGNVADDAEKAGGGGGISNLGTLTLTESTISDNRGGDDGGGLHQDHGGTMTLTASTVSGNSAVTGHGGGLAIFSGDLTITNSTISGNRAGSNGGGIWIGGAGLTMFNSTVSGNCAGVEGGGIMNGGTANIMNSILANGLCGGNCSGSTNMIDGGGNLADDSTCGTVPDTLSGFDVVLTDNGGPTMTHALLEGSTAIDAAMDCDLSTDQRGFLRNDGLCDTGSFEFGAADLIFRNGFEKLPNTITILDNTAPNVGRSNTIAIGGDGLPLIAYFDRSNQQLKVAKCVNVLCTSAVISVVDAAAGYGSMTIGADGLPIISYADAVQQSLKVAKCNDGACSGGDEVISLVDERATGRNSIAIGTDGLPVISYQGAGSKLVVAKCNDLACSGGDETISTLNDAAQFTGGQASIAIPADGLPVISYKQLTGSPMPSYLMVAKCNDVACSGADESISQVAETGLAMYESTAITIAEDGLPLIAFTDSGDGIVAVIKCNDPACADEDEVENIISDLGGSQHVSVAIGLDGRPVVVYGGSLQVAHCDDYACTGGEATVSEVDPVGSSLASVTIGTDGLPVISYFAFSNPPSQLKTVHCGSAGC